MKISIITAVYNNVATIEQTMRSVQEQTYPQVEHVIVDGQSADGTVEVVQRWLRDQDQFVSEPDEGIYDALNKGVRMSTGDVVGIIGGDDFLAGREALSHVAEAFDETGVDAVYGNLVYVRGDSRRVRRFWKSSDYHPGGFSRGWVPPHPAFFCRRELFERWGYFRLDLPVAADFEWMLRLIEKHRISLKHVNQTITVMRLGGTSNQFGGIVRGNANIVKAFRVNGLHFPWLYFLRKPLRRLRQYGRAWLMAEDCWP